MAIGSAPACEGVDDLLGYIKLATFVAIMALCGFAVHTAISSPLFWDVVQTSGVVLACLTSLFLVRTLICSVLTYFGAYDSKWDQYIPRIPWRPLWHLWLWFREWFDENFRAGQPNAGKAGAITQLALRWKPGDSLLGRVRLPLGIPHYRLIGENSERHTVLAASARSGKSVWLETLVALMSEMASGFFIDPKGSLTQSVLIPRERRGQKLFVIDAMSQTDRPSDNICMIQQIDNINAAIGMDRTTMLCDRISGTHFPPEDNEKAFFRIAGTELLAGAICFNKIRFPDTGMPHVRKLLSVGFIEEAGGDPKKGLEMFFQAMVETPDYDGYVSRRGAAILEMDDKTKANVLATVQGRMAYWDHAEIKAVSGKSAVNLCDLKRQNKSVMISLPLPVGDMRTTLRPWVGAIYQLAMAAMEWIPGDLDPKTAFVVEEAQALGETALSGLGETAALMAGYGVSLYVVVQDLPGFRKGFPKDYKSVIGNAGHVVFMGTNDHETYEFIAHQAFGQKTVRRKKWHIPFLWTVESRIVDVTTPDQVRRYLESGKSNAIVMRNGKRSMWVKIPYSYRTLPIWLIDPHPQFGETPARAWFRSIYVQLFASEPAPTSDAAPDDEKVIEFPVPASPARKGRPTPAEMRRQIALHRQQRGNLKKRSGQ